MRNIESRNLDSMEKAEEIFQARQRIHDQIGQILPSLHLGQMVAILQMDFIDLISSFLGFIYPSNWYQWKSKKSLYYAELYSHKSLMANQMSQAITLCFEIHALQEAIRIYENFQNEVNDFLEMSREKSKEENLSLRDLYAVEVFQSHLHQDLDLLKFTEQSAKHSLQGLMMTDIPQDSLFIDFDPSKDFEEKSTLSQERVQSSIERSPEMRMYFYLIRSAKSRHMSSYFDFFSRNGNQSNAFGYGFYHRIQISKSSKKVLKIKREKTSVNIEHALEEAFANRDLYEHLQQDHIKGISKCKQWKSLLKTEWETQEHCCATTMLLKAINCEIEATAKASRQRYLVLQTQSQIQRLELKGPFEKYAYQARSAS